MCTQKPPCQLYAASFRCSTRYTSRQCRHLHSRSLRHSRTTPQHCAEPSPHRSVRRLCSVTSKAIPRDASSPQRVHSRAEPLPARKAHSFYHSHIRGGSAPNSSGPVHHSKILPHFFNLTLDSGTLPQRLPSVRDPQTPSAYPTWYQFCLINDHRCSAISAPPTYPIVYRASPVSIGRVDQAPFPSTERHPPPLPPFVRLLRAPAHQRTEFVHPPGRYRKAEEGLSP